MRHGSWVACGLMFSLALQLSCQQEYQSPCRVSDHRDLDLALPTSSFFPDSRVRSYGEGVLFSSQDLFRYELALINPAGEVESRRSIPLSTELSFSRQLFWTGEGLVALSIRASQTDGGMGSEPSDAGPPDGGSSDAGRFNVLPGQPEEQEMVSQFISPEGNVEAPQVVLKGVPSTSYMPAIEVSGGVLVMGLSSDVPRLIRLDPRGRPVETLRSVWRPEGSFTFHRSGRDLYVVQIGWIVSSTPSLFWKIDDRGELLAGPFELHASARVASGPNQDETSVIWVEDSQILLRTFDAAGASGEVQRLSSGHATLSAAASSSLLGVVICDSSSTGPEAESDYLITVGADHRKVGGDLKLPVGSCNRESAALIAHEGNRFVYLKFTSTVTRTELTCEP